MAMQARRRVPFFSQIGFGGCSVLACAILLSGCATVSVGKRSTADAIMDQRMTVLTGSQLSHDTRSRLLQAGLDPDSCLANMPSCVVSLKQASLSEDKGLYGAYSELFYSAAQLREQGKNCRVTPQQLSTAFAKQLLASPTSASTVEPTLTGETEKTPATDLSKDTLIDCKTAYQDDMLQAVRFAYIYLMYDLLDKPANILLADVVAAQTLPQNHLYYLPKERDVQIQDLYNAAIDALGDRLYEQQLTPNYQVTNNQIHLMLNGEPFGENNKAAKLVSSYQINLSGLNSISRRDGFGMNYVAILDDRYTTSIRNQILNRQPDGLPASERIHTLGHLPVTALLIPKGQTLQELMTTHDFTLAVFDPYRFNSTQLFGKKFALSANFSAPYGLWLSENSLYPVSLFNLLGTGFQSSDPHLFMLEPYDPNKRVLIMLHGLASSPDTWVRLTNDIFNDPTLRDNYQVWQVFYPTNIPILENRYQIYELLSSAFGQVDPRGKDRASQHAVIIGHSMGGIIGRMLVSNDDLTTNLKQTLDKFNANDGFDGDYRLYAKMSKNQDWRNRFVLKALPQVDRAVFISAPFQGTTYADKWFTRAIRRIISLPKGFVQTVSTNLASLSNEQGIVVAPLTALFLENGASQLSDRSFFMALTKDLQMASHVKVNNLIATDDKDLYDALNNPQQSQPAVSDTTALTPVTDQPAASVAPPMTTVNRSNVASTLAATPSANLYSAESLQQAQQKLEDNKKLLRQVSQGATDRLSDGVVPYDSAHLEGIESEKILTGGHSVHTSPQAVLELRRILHLHLLNNGKTTDKIPDRQP